MNNKIKTSNSKMNLGVSQSRGRARIDTTSSSPSGANHKKSGRQGSKAPKDKSKDPRKQLTKKEVQAKEAKKLKE